jgi:hypothetical protein
MLPWWGGIGPNLWRQVLTVSRSPSRLAGMVFLFALPVGLTLWLSVQEPRAFVPVFGSLIGLALFAPSAVGCDFRPDLRHMEELKTMPVRPTRLVIGQLLTPVILLSLCEWLSLALLGVRGEPGLLVAAAVLIVPANLLLVGVENLYFLWYPYRTSGANSFDFQAVGRQMLLLMFKGTTVGVAVALAAGAGALVFFFAGQSWAATVAAAAAVLTGLGLALVPLVAEAFERFDVAANLPE